MKVSAIKKIAQEYELQDLKNAEACLLEEKDLEIEIDGEDEGEKLTHIIAAIQIKTDCEQQEIPLAKAIRNYTQRVRKSIS